MPIAKTRAAPSADIASAWDLVPSHGVQRNMITPEILRAMPSILLCTPPLKRQFSLESSSKGWDSLKWTQKDAPEHDYTVTTKQPSNCHKKVSGTPI